VPDWICALRELIFSCEAGPLTSEEIDFVVLSSSQYDDASGLIETLSR
jgi:hypothetical protein